MYKLAISTLLVGSAAAFAPSSQSARASTSLAAADVVKGPYENELGAQAPLGFFDPFGMTAGQDKEKFEHLRWVELKHGRIAMLAVVGMYIRVKFSTLCSVKIDVFALAVCSDRE